MSSSSISFVLIFKYFKMKILSREFMFCYHVSVPVQSAYILIKPVFNEKVSSIITMTKSSLTIVLNITITHLVFQMHVVIYRSYCYCILCNHFRVQLSQVLSTWCIENKYIYQSLSFIQILVFIFNLKNRTMVGVKQQIQSCIKQSKIVFDLKIF